MKKILFIDPLSPDGHVQYNSYWLRVLNELECEYDIIFKEKYKKNFNLEKNVYEIPEEFYIKINSTKNFFKKRYYLFLILKWIKNIENSGNYDYIIFSSFENFSYFIYNLIYKNKKNYLILHNNLEKLNNVIIKTILKIISQKNILISLSEGIKKNLEAKGIKSEIIIHPIPDPFDKKYFKKIKKTIFFSPSKSSIDEDMINNIFKSQKIKKTNKIFFLRSSEYEGKCFNVEVIKKRLSNLEYENLFKEADVILLPYKKTFQNRVSNIFFEAIANEKQLLIQKGSYLDYYSLDCDIIYFENIFELEKIVQEIKIKKPKYLKIKKENSLEKMKMNIVGLFGERDEKI